jgi:hypothetical protein
VSRIRAWRCERCKKTGHRQLAHARANIATILRNPFRQSSRPDPFLWALKPYRCPHGVGWHVGHDWHLVTWMTEELKKRKVA